MGLGIWEVMVIFLIVLLFFGAKRLPEIARSMGHAVNEFKKAKDEVLNSPVPSAPAAPPAPTVVAEVAAAPKSLVQPGADLPQNQPQADAKQ